MVRAFFGLGTDARWLCGVARLAVRADVAELVDAHGSGPCGLRLVEVQVLSSASLCSGRFRPSPYLQAPPDTSSPGVAKTEARREIGLRAEPKMTQSGYLSTGRRVAPAT